MESSSWGSTTDLLDAGLGYGESVKDSTSKFILRFVERVCIEAGVTAQHLRSLTQNIPSKCFTSRCNDILRFLPKTLHFVIGARMW